MGSMLKGIVHTMTDKSRSISINVLELPASPTLSTDYSDLHLFHAQLLLPIEL